MSLSAKIEAKQKHVVASHQDRHQQTGQGYQGYGHKLRLCRIGTRFCLVQGYKRVRNI